MQTRFVYTCISSLLFAGETTLDELHQAFADDAADLFEKGFLVALLHIMGLTATCLGASNEMTSKADKDRAIRVYLVCIGVKGDQVFVRKDSPVALGNCLHVHTGLQKNVGHLLLLVANQAKAFHMRVGFNCKEKCHLCMAQAFVSKHPSRFFYRILGTWNPNPMLASRIGTTLAWMPFGEAACREPPPPSMRCQYRCCWFLV